MKLANLTENLNNPCILDIKLGYFYNNFLNKKSKKRLIYTNAIYENTTSKTFGFRIAGLSVFYFILFLSRN